MSKGNLPEVFLDTDVSFDIISKRAPHFDQSVAMLQLASEGRISLLISESSIANLIYLTFDIYKMENANEIMIDFIGSCEVISAGKQVVLNALRSGFKDKEDAVQYYTALHYGADYFITRNIKDYTERSNSLPVLTPAGFKDTLA